MNKKKFRRLRESATKRKTKRKVQWQRVINIAKRTENAMLIRMYIAKLTLAMDCVHTTIDIYARSCTPLHICSFVLRLCNCIPKMESIKMREKKVHYFLRDTSTNCKQFVKLHVKSNVRVYLTNPWVAVLWHFWRGKNYICHHPSRNSSNHSDLLQIAHI